MRLCVYVCVCVCVCVHHCACDSLYNAVNYLLGLHIIRELAGSQSDATTVAESQAMIHRVQKSIQVRKTGLGPSFNFLVKSDRDKRIENGLFCIYGR